MNAINPEPIDPVAHDFLTAIGCEITRTEFNEYRVNFRKGCEPTAYYTDDLDDAVGTVLVMANEGAVA